MTEITQEWATTRIEAIRQMQTKINENISAYKAEIEKLEKQFLVNHGSILLCQEILESLQGNETKEESGGFEDAQVKGEENKTRKKAA